MTARGEALLRFAHMLSGQRHTAEDLVQSVLGRAYPRWARIAVMEQPEAYLKRMVVHEHLRWLRRRSSTEVPVAAAPDQPAPQDDPGGDHARRDAAWALLGRLPTGARSAGAC